MLQKFQNYLRVNGKSNSTVNNYANRAKVFLRSIGSDITRISSDTIAEFLLGLQTTNKVETINAYRNGILAFVRWLKLDVEVPKLLKVPILERPAITLTQLENSVMPITEHIDFKNRLKWKAIFYFMFFTGIRISELHSISRKDIDLKNLLVKIYEQKKHQERVVCFTKRVAHILDLYFISEAEEKNAFNISPSSVRTFLKKINEYFKDEHLHPHLFRHCVSQDTMALTVDGWKSYKHLCKNEKIFTYNFLKNIIELNPLLNVNIYKYQGEMFHINNYYLDILITPEHKHPFKLAKEKQLNYKRWTAWEKNWELYTLPKLLNTPNKRLISTIISAKYNGEKSVGKAKAYLLGLIMTDGHIAYKNRKTPDVTISQSISANKSKCDKIESILIQSKLQYSKRIQKVKISFFTGKPCQMVVFRILKNSRHWIWKYLTKQNIPVLKTILQLKQQELKIMFDAMMLADGTRDTEFTDQNKQTINLIRILCVLLGYRTSKHTTTKIRTYITYKHTVQIREKHINTTPYNGIVWCPETTNGTWIAKRNDTIFITGNSYAEHVLHPGHNRQGIGIETLSKLLGHTNILTTMRYLKFDIKKAQVEYNRCIK